MCAPRLLLVLLVLAPAAYSVPVSMIRYSDGLSSTSPLTTTSPSFPPYRGTQDGSVVSRKAHAATVALSRDEQGIAESGAGGFDIEVARYRRLHSGVSLAQAPTTLFSVNAAARWNPSGFAVQAGETYTIDVLAGGQWSTGAVVTDADGISPQYDATQQCWTYNTTCLTHQNYDATRLPPPQGRLLQLVCGVGDMQSAPAAVAEGLDWAMPLREEKFTDTLFAAGSYVEITPRFTGELVCFANDANDLYFDNNGTVTVNVTRLSWPPATTFTESYVQYFSSAPNITLGY